MGHRHRFSRRRGIALITAVMFALVMSVVARGIMHLNLGSQSQQAVYDKRARQAALSGQEYAKSQLALDSEWRGADGRRRTVETESLVVEEVGGNVVGLITYPDGGRAQFRIRFNAQDGPDGFDGQDDPESGFAVDNEMLSVNNLSGAGEVELPGPAGSSDGAPTTVPSHAVLLQVEGRAGKAIDRMDPDEPNSTPGGYVKAAGLQTVLKATLEEVSGPAVLQAGGDIVMSVGSAVNVSSASETSPSIRSKQAISAKQLSNPMADAPLNMDDGDIYCLNGMSSLDAIIDPEQVTVHDESPGSDFLELTWDQVDKPDSEAMELSGGVYVLWPPDSEGSGGSNGTGLPGGGGSGATLHYYDMTYQQYMQEIFEPFIMQGQMPPDEGVVVGGDLGGLRPGGDAEQHPNGIAVDGNVITITEDLAIVPSGNDVTDFAVIPLADAPMSDGDPVPPGSATTTGGGSKDIYGYGGDPLTINVDSARIYSPGDMVFKGANVDVHEATLIGEKDLLFNASQLAVTGDEQNLSLYFQGDVSMSSYRGQTSDYGDFDIAGTVYTWQNFSANLASATPGSVGDGGGVFNFRGTLVAYGGDPNSQDPGDSEDGGMISIAANAAELIYDPSSVTQIVPPESLGANISLMPLSFWIR